MNNQTHVQLRKTVVSLWSIMRQVTACMKEAQPPNTATMTQNKRTHESRHRLKTRESSRRDVRSELVTNMK